MNSKKLVLLLVIGVVVALFLRFGGHEILTLENLQKHQSAIEQWISQNLLAAVLGFAGVYVVVTALSLPGAAIISRVGRALAEAGGKELLQQAHSKVDPQYQRTIDLQWYGPADTNGNQWLP